MSGRLVTSLPLDPLPLLILLHLANLGKHDFPKNGPARNLAQTPLLSSTSGAIGRCASGRFAIGRSRRERLGITGIGRSCHICGTGDVFLVILLHLESIDAVREFDDLNAAPETGLGVVGTDFRQQIAVAGGFTLQPWVLESLLGRNAVCRVGMKEGEDEVSGILGDVAPVAVVEDNPAAAGLFDQVGEVLRAERRVTAEKGVGDNSQRPHVDGLAVALLEHNFRRGISKRSSHAGEELGGGFQHLGNTKVCKDEGRVGCGGKVEEVFGFQVY